MLTINQKKKKKKKQNLKLDKAGSFFRNPIGNKNHN